MYVTHSPIFINKNTEHHIELYNEEKILYTDHTQVMGTTKFFGKINTNQIMSINESSSFIDTLDNNYGNNSDLLSNFTYLEYSGFYNFFKYNSVDIPQCFSQSKSLINPTNNLPFLKFSTFIMRHGLKQKINKHLFKSMYSLLTDYHNLNSLTLIKNWKTVFISFNSLVYTKNFSQIFTFKNEILSYNSRLTSEVKYLTSDFNYYYLIFRNLKKLEPIFSFYIYKVDKKIYKNTRGKSGKYTFLWKYIPVYKRQFLIFTWLVKELQLKPGLDLTSRLINLLTNLLHNPSQTWIYRVKRFSNNYVYRNCRRTLAESYRTVTK